MNEPKTYRPLFGKLTAQGKMFEFTGTDSLSALLFQGSESE